MKNTFALPRREFCARGLKWIVAGAGMGLIASCGKDNSGSAAVAACVDPDSLNSAAINLRESLDYAAVSSVENKTCAGCAFFTGDAEDGQCGNCQILQGTVNATGYCTSWSPAS